MEYKVGSGFESEPALKSSFRSFRGSNGAVEDRGRSQCKRRGSERNPGGSVDHWLQIRFTLLKSKVRVGKNPGLFKKTQPSGVFWVFWFFLGFWVFCPEERVLGFFSVSRILLGASRL